MGLRVLSKARSILEPLFNAYNECWREENSGKGRHQGRAWQGPWPSHAGRSGRRLGDGGKRPHSHVDENDGELPVPQRNRHHDCLEDAVQGGRHSSFLPWACACVDSGTFVSFWWVFWNFFFALLCAFILLRCFVLHCSRRQWLPTSHLVCVAIFISAFWFTNQWNQSPFLKWNTIGDTAANTGVLALMNANDSTKDLPVWAKTNAASAGAAIFRIFLMPIDTFKTTMQVQVSLSLEELYVIEGSYTSCVLFIRQL